MSRRKRRQAAAEPRQKPQTGRRYLRSVRWALLVVLGAGVVFGWALATGANKRRRSPRVDGYEIINVYPHDPDAFCQGLVFEQGVLYESTGRYGRSSLRRVDLESGKVLKMSALNERLFGEGITIFDDSIIQLTWRSGIGIVYEKASLEPQSTFRYRGEGWGITTVGQRLMMSDGSATLRVLDPKTFRVLDTLTVRSGGVPVRWLNELEYVEGEIYANVYGLDRIARISPKTGEVVGWIDLAGLAKGIKRPSPEAVLNGIAYDPEGKRLLVTGKLWPKLFEIRVVPQR